MIPEQAIAAAARIVFAEGVAHGWWKEPQTYEALDPIGKEEFDAFISRALEAAQPLMGVQRPEDVARVDQHKLVRIELDTSGVNDRYYPHCKCGWRKPGHIFSQERAIEYFEEHKRTVLALPHPGQPQEGPQRAPESCPNCIDETDCSHVPICRAVDEVSPAPQAGCAKEGEALREIYEWYDRDGSVGTATTVFEKHRALLAQRIEHEPSKLGVEGSNPSERATPPPPPVAESGWQEKPRLLSEWNEDCGDVLWWKFPIDEPPYVGTPNDIGRPVLVQVRTDRDQKEHALPSMTVNVGGWPGYHTHWTPLRLPAPSHIAAVKS